MESFLDERDVVCYHPIKPCSSNSPRSVQLTSPSFVNVSYHDLQLLHHGSTAIRCDVSTPASALCHLRLETDNATLTWTRPNWCPTQAAAPGVTPLDGLPSFDDDVSCVSAREFASRCHGKVLIVDDFEEGFVSLNVVNEVLVTSCAGERAGVARKFNLGGDASSEAVCISLFCGTSLTENKCLDFVLPARSAALWGASLRRLQACCWIQKHRVADRRLLWLKKQYLSLCSDEAGKRRSPTVAEAVAVSAPLFLCFFKSCISTNVMSVFFRPDVWRTQANDVNEQPVSSERRERLEQRSVQELGQAEESEVGSGDVIGEGRGALVAGSQPLTGELLGILHQQLQCGRCDERCALSS